MATSVSMVLRTSIQRTIDPDEFLSRLIEHATEEEFIEKLRRTQELLQRRPSEQEIIELLGNGGTAHESVITAIYCFLANLNSFEDAVVQAVNLGGDTDTIGAMTGALSGAHHGKTGIPERWLESLENGPKGRDYIESLGVRLWELTSGSGC
jgi:poly(ADP-ribose) glycohydrolase ARH3